MEPYLATAGTHRPRNRDWYDVLSPSCAVHTLSDLRQPYQFQAISGQTRLVFELCVDIHLLAKKIANDVEKFHGFTRRPVSAQRTRQSSSTTRIRSSKTREMRKNVGTRRHTWQARRNRGLMPETLGERTNHQNTGVGCDGQSSLTGWSRDSGVVRTVVEVLMRGWFMVEVRMGACSDSAVALDRVLCREKALSLVPEAYRLVAVEMHMHRALPTSSTNSIGSWTGS